MQFAVSLSATTEAFNSFLSALPTQALPRHTFLPPKVSHMLVKPSHSELYPQPSGEIFKDRRVVITGIHINVISLYLLMMQRLVSLVSRPEITIPNQGLCESSVVMNLTVTAVIIIRRQVLHSLLTQSSREAQMLHSFSLVYQIFAESKQLTLVWFESYVFQSEPRTPDVEKDDLI